MTEAASFALNLVPRGVCGTTLKHVDFLAGNVPGFDVPVHLAGTRVLAYYPFGPAFGSAVNATLMSYAGTCFVGWMPTPPRCPTARSSPCVQEGFREVFAAGTPVRIPTQRTAGCSRRGSAS